MTDFKIRRGLSTELFIDGEVNPKLVITEGCWYLCTDTAELFLGVVKNGKLDLARINEGSITTPESGAVTVERVELTEAGELIFYYSNGVSENFGCITGKDGAETSIEIGETLYSPKDGIVKLPEFATKEYVDAQIANIKMPTKISDLQNDAGYISSVPEEYVTENELNAKGYLQVLNTNTLVLNGGDSYN